MRALFRSTRLTVGSALAATVAARPRWRGAEVRLKRANWRTCSSLSPSGPATLRPKNKAVSRRRTFANVTQRHRLSEHRSSPAGPFRGDDNIGPAHGLPGTPIGAQPVPPCGQSRDKHPRHVLGCVDGQVEPRCEGKGPPKLLCRIEHLPQWLPNAHLCCRREPRKPPP